MKNLLLILFIGSLFTACKKDCLEKEDCELSTYTSTYLTEADAPVASGVVYYVDASDGKKNNDGKSVESAFESIEQINELSLSPGDQILFKRGQVHYGVLIIESSGTAEENIYLSDYGSGHLPVIKSTDGDKNSDESTVYLNLASYITFQNLNIQGGLFAMSLSNSDYVTIQGWHWGAFTCRHFSNRQVY
jgi:hypothetical protein